MCPLVYLLTMKMTTILASVSLTMLGHTAVVIGDAFAIDFGDVAPDSSTIFTHAAGARGTLSDINGTGVGFSWDADVSTATGIFYNSDSADSMDLPGIIGYDDTVLTDWIGEYDSSGPASLVLSFSGLDDSLEYSLVIGHGFVNNGTVTDTTYTVDGQSLTNVHDDGANAFVSFTGLYTDGSGNLVITTDDPNGNVTAVSALVLRAIPEPSSLTLIGLGALALFTRRNRD